MVADGPALTPRNIKNRSGNHSDRAIGPVHPGPLSTMLSRQDRGSSRRMKFRKQKEVRSNSAAKPEAVALQALYANNRPTFTSKPDQYCASIHDSLKELVELADRHGPGNQNVWKQTEQGFAKRYHVISRRPQLAAVWKCDRERTGRCRRWRKALGAQVDRHLGHPQPGRLDPSR